MTKIWFRYFLLEFWKIFFLVLGSFYFFYVLIDFSTHSKSFHGAPFSQILFYYACHFSKQADILLTTALMIGTIKVLSTMNLKNELVALVASGISLKKVCSPFLFASLLTSLFLYCNFQFLQPRGLTLIDGFEERYFDSTCENVRKRVHALLLADQSLFLYQFFDSDKDVFFDTYWIRNLDEIYKIQTLFPKEIIPKGEHVDVLKRNSKGELILAASHACMDFPEMQFNQNTLLSEIRPPFWQSYSDLSKNFSFLEQLTFKKKFSDREAACSSAFFYKFFLSLMPFLAVLGPAPFCLSFTRNLKVFSIFSLSLFSVFAFFTCASCCLVLSERQLLPSFWSFFILFFAAIYMSIKGYAKI